MKYNFNFNHDIIKQTPEEDAEDQARLKAVRIKLVKERLAQAKKGDLSFLSKMAIVPGKDWKFSPITGEPHTWVGYLQKKVKDLEVER